MGLLIDSTVFIQAERSRHTPSELISALLERFGDEELALSVMSAGELFHGCCRADTPRRRARREDFVEAVMAAVPSIPITLPVMRIFGRLDAAARLYPGNRSEAQRKRVGRTRRHAAIARQSPWRLHSGAL